VFILQSKFMNIYSVRLLLILVLLFSFILSSYARPNFGGRVASQVSNAVKKQVRAAIIPTLSTKKNKIEYPEVMKQSSDDRYLALSMEGGYISIWDMKSGKEIDNVSLKKIQFKDFVIDSFRKELYLINQQGQLLVKPLVAGEDFKKQKKIQGKHQFNFVRSNAKSLLLTTKKNEVVLFDKNSKKQLQKIKINSEIIAIDIAENANNILISTRDKKLFVYNSKNNKAKLKLLQQWNLSNKVKKISLNKKGTGLVIQYKNDHYAYARMKAERFGEIVKSREAVSFVDLSADVLNAVTKKNRIFNQNIVTGKISDVAKLEKIDLKTALFYKNAKYLLVPKRKAGVAVIQAKTGKKLVQLLSTKTGWAALDRHGRYDGNEDAFQDVSWDADGKLLDLDQFSEKYFEPGLLVKVLDKKQPMITKPVVKIEKGLYLPPEVSIKALR